MKMVKNNFFRFLGKIGLGRLIRYYLAKKEWKGSADYWQSRYSLGLNSGIGSFNRLSEFKAKVINSFVRDKNINKVIEFGCGDGNQLLLADYPFYIGYDVAEEAIKMCKERFKGDGHKQFHWSGDPTFVCSEKADLTISLDVIYHLVEDEVFEKYMKQLFESSEKYVCIYSCNYDEISNIGRHVRPRKFTNWIERHCSQNWKLLLYIKNEYPYDINDPENTSFSDFYFYELSNHD